LAKDSKMASLNNKYKITDFIRDGIKNNRLVLFRDQEELVFLKKWLVKDAVLPENNHKTNDVNETADLSLASIIERCKKCGDVTAKKKPFGSGKNGLMIVLNAPRLISSRELDSYKIESGNLIRKMIGAIGFDLKECYVTNLIKCEPKDSFLRPSMMVKNCEDILKKEIGFINPERVIVMGDIVPLQKIISDSDIEWFNINHPVTILKNPELKRPAWNTLKLLKDKSN